MKIAFIALALMLSATTHADELLPAAVSGVVESNTVVPLNDAEIRAQKRKLADELREREHQATKPKCINIQFTGVATPLLYGHAVIAQALSSNDIEDTLARNPIQCRSNQFGNRECTGVAYFQNKKGRIVTWGSEFYIIDTTLDFDTGRRNIELTIRRKDAVCVK